jgi:hypothetical protein
MIKDRIFGSDERSGATERVAMSVGLEFYGLQEHLISCRSHSSLSFNLKCALDRVQSFVFTRVVTTVTGVSLLVGVGYLLA